MSSVQRKFNVKSLGENLEKGPQKKTSGKNMMYPVVKASSIETTNALNTLNLCLFREVVNDILELLQRFKSLHVYDAARKQSSNFAYLCIIPVTVKILIYFLSPIVFKTLGLPNAFWKARISNFRRFRTFSISDFFAGPVGAWDSRCPL